MMDIKNYDKIKSIYDSEQAKMCKNLLDLPDFRSQSQIKYEEILARKKARIEQQ